MTDETAGRTLDREELAAMVRVVRPDWRLRAATPATSGWTALYHLDVETGAGRRRCVLKASPDDGRRAGVDVEARVLAVLDAHTDVPVPEVLGTVDEHGDLRTPYFLVAAMPGESVAPSEVGALPAATLRSVARETGRHLGQLHGLEVGLDAFGETVDFERSRRLRGGRPTADPSRLFVREGRERWPALLRDWFDADLEALSTSRFGDLAPALRAEQARRLDALPAGFAPVLGRTDHHWDNRLVDRDDGTVVGVLDWEGTPAVTRGLSLVYAEEGLATKLWKARPEVPDRRSLVREALLAGYRAEASIPATLAIERACYRLNLLVRDMAAFEERTGSERSPVPEGRVQEASSSYRAVARAELDGDRQ